MEEAALADRVVVMADGQIVLEGAPRQVFQATEQLRALRLNLPPAVAAASALRAAGLALPSAILTMDELVEALCQLHSKP
jgi:energy-coupling factor transport system ATP-binding protein